MLLVSGHDFVTAVQCSAALHGVRGHHWAGTVGGSIFLLPRFFARKSHQRPLPDVQGPRGHCGCFSVCVL